MITLDEFISFIVANSGTTIEFGSKEQAPTAEWIARAESALNCALPVSYRWFLENYGGGEIHGDEVFSIYQLPFDEVIGGDVVARTLYYRRNGYIENSDISIYATDYGEIFALDGHNLTDDGEFPVVRILGKNRLAYAESFADFIVKIVGDSAVNEVEKKSGEA